jgi:1-deoxy-D-xylulose-5-phosphate reductoisomerase
MRTPIQYALEGACGGGRSAGVARRLAWEELRGLEFSPPDLERFPALGLAYRAIAAGGSAGAVLNAANEAAVEAFLKGAIPFGRIAEVVRGAMDAVPDRDVGSLDGVLVAEHAARESVRSRIQ